MTKEKETHKQKYKAVIFDMDGTIVDNMMVHHRAWQKILHQLGLKYSLERVRKEIHGVNMELFEQLFPDKYTMEQKRELSHQKEALYREQAKELELLPGFTNFLESLVVNEIPVGIGTAAPPENVSFIMNQFQLHSRIPHIVDSSMVNNGKPHPEVYQKVAQKLNCSLADCIVFEDSPTGAKAAENGDAALVIVTTTHQPEEFSNIDGILHFIDDFTDMSFLEVKHSLLTAS